MKQSGSGRSVTVLAFFTCISSAAFLFYDQKCPYSSKISMPQMHRPDHLLSFEVPDSAEDVETLLAADARLDEPLFMTYMGFSLKFSGRIVLQTVLSVLFLVSASSMTVVASMIARLA